MERRIVIIGAGPTGLGAARRLQDLGHENWVLVEAADAPGGLSSSVVDERGFTWDRGGHVLFSRYQYFDDLMDEVVNIEWGDHVREAWVWMRGRLIPFPLQLNIWHLPPDDLILCLEGLLAVYARPAAGEAPQTFHDWIVTNFGQGLADTFMLPYNRKVWACDPRAMSTGWLGIYVATVDLPRVLRNLVFEKDDVGWGPNARFRYPLRGGTGAIWKALHARLSQSHIQMGRRVTGVRSGARILQFEDGGTLSYDSLISTMPLDHLLRALHDRSDLRARAGELKYSSVHVVGVGLDGTPPENLRTTCWIYFPEPDVPFYRVTVFSNYSANHVPRPGQQWSLLCEVSESSENPVNGEHVHEAVLAGLRRVGLVGAQELPASVWKCRIESAYPTPFFGRDAVLDAIDPELRQLGIWSRGRFGAWKYEVSSQDHSVMQGVEAIDHILSGGEETTYHDPAAVNSRMRS